MIKEFKVNQANGQYSIDRLYKNIIHPTYMFGELTKIILILMA